jgi:hypothetical protein
VGNNRLERIENALAKHCKARCNLIKGKILDKESGRELV